MIIVKPLHPDGWMHENPEAVLQEMAFPRKKVEDHLVRYSGALFTHLLKIFYFRNNHHDLRGWVVTVHKCVFSLPKVKAPKGKKDYRLSTESIYELLWGEWNDDFPAIHTGMLKDFNYKDNPEYANLPYIYAGGDVNRAEGFLKDYYIWLAKNLSAKEKIILSEVQDEIKGLLRKYPYSK
jgi:hypothetical protein